MPEDFYQMLGVGRHASRQSLKRAFHERLKDIHPDHNPGDTLACERTRHLIEAYKTLSNPISRRRYDASLAPVSPPPHRYSAPPPLLHPLIAGVLPVVVFILTGLVTAALAITIAERIP